MVDWYEVLDPALSADLDPHTGAVVVDLGLACNHVSMVLCQASAIERAEQAAQHAAQSHAGRTNEYQAKIADQIASGIVGYVEQLTVVYTQIAVSYAVKASQFVLHLLAGMPPESAPLAQDILPSHLLSNLATALPTVAAPGDGYDDVDWSDLRRGYLDIEAAVRRYHDGGGPLDAYDDQAAAAKRGSDDSDLPSDLAEALHAYAAYLISIASSVRSKAGG